MIQNIEPHNFNNEFRQQTPLINDIILLFSNNEVLMNTSCENIEFPKIGQINKLKPDIIENSIYLFSIDNTGVFCSFETIEETTNLKYFKTSYMKETLPQWMAFIAATAHHLFSWYTTNKFCGRCASKMNLSKTERALCCPECGLIIYPKINPVIIVGIINDDKILLTKYADRPYNKFSLVAGYVEIGETLEDTIKREVMEEVGLRVKNMRYYKSQPWAFSQSLLMGFFAELDGSSIVKLDEKELKSAGWYSPEEIPVCETSLSLTNEMIELFRNNKVNSNIFG